MKKILFLFAFSGLVAFSASAQSKSCCAGKTAAAKQSCATTAVAAEKAATEDASIVKQVSNTGEVSYTRKEVCPTSGKVSYTTVEYAAESGKFVNVSPAEVNSCSKTATATKVSSTGKKSGCCAGGAAKAACGSKAEKTASTESVAEPVNEEKQ
ncbi:MAG: hypothetical protein RI973_931 [Bacteroidota bacterium]|jgi:hypothetical protein